MDSTNQYGVRSLKMFTKHPNDASSWSVVLFLIATIVAPLFSTIADFIYLLCIVVGFRKIVIVPKDILFLAFIVLSGLLLILFNASAGFGYFSFFFFRLALLYVVYALMPPVSLDGRLRAALVIIFVIYCSSIFYEYAGLPGAEILKSGDGQNLLENPLNYRASGLFSGYYSATVVCGFLLAFLSFSSEAKKTAIFYPLMLGVTFCSGRAGIVIVIGCLLAVAYKSPREFIALVPRVVLFLLAFIVLSAVFISLDLEKLQNTGDLFAQVLPILVGDYSGTSTEALFTAHYYVPSDWSTWLVGNNLRPFTENGVKSDSGYVQFLFGAGLPLSIFYFLFLIRAVRRHGAALSVFLFTLIIILSIKGNIFNAIGVLDLLFFSISISRRSHYARGPGQKLRGFAAKRGRVANDLADHLVKNYK